MAEDANEIRVWGYDEEAIIFRGTEKEVCEFLMGEMPGPRWMKILRHGESPIDAWAWFAPRLKNTRDNLIYGLVEASLSITTDTLEEIKTEARSTTDAILRLIDTDPR